MQGKFVGDACHAYCMAKLNTNKGGKKLNYIHNNPIAEHWQLVNDPCKYVYSTCKYYETGENNYTFIKDLRNEF